jgi:hypothetical protein
MTARTRKSASATWAFTRVVGKLPPIAPCRRVITTSLQTLVESFGPPERHHAMKNSLYWKFCRQDGARAFSLLAELPKEDAKEIEVQVYAIRFSKSFCDWALDRIGETENGDADPMFLGAENFIVAPAK